MQQLKHIMLPDKARWEGAYTDPTSTPNLWWESLFRYDNCLDALEAALERDAMQTYRDGTLQEDAQARETCRAAYQKLHDAETPIRTGLRYR